MFKPSRLILKKSILSSISITVQVCARDLYRIILLYNVNLFIGLFPVLKNCERIDPRNKVENSFVIP